MSILGPQEMNEFLKNLDARKILNLCADILYVDGHTDIKIMEGPGDGQRDIHSINSNGEKCLTQSKFHSELSYTVSAKELGEVVLGMVRFGYTKGLFITNVRISPQAKRDCLSDYPDHSVDFLEGENIFNRVLDSLLLKAIWYDGHSLDAVSYTINFPIISRDLETDKPLPLLPQHINSQIGNTFQAGRSEVQINYQRNNSHIHVFGEYRSPTRKTPHELGSTQIGVTEAILSGIIHIGDINQILSGLRKETISHFKRIHKNKKHFALIFGSPSLTPLGGQSSGARIELEDTKPITYVEHGDFQGEEADWILPSQNVGWILPKSPSVTQAKWIRWYNQKYDICFDVIVSSHPSDQEKWLITEQRDLFVKWWNQSLFMLVPHDIVRRWKSTKIPVPSKWHKWNKTNSLGLWLHPVLRNPFVQTSIEPEYEDLELHFGTNELEKINKEMDVIRKNLESLGSTFVNPEKARHMIAVIANDPYPNAEQVQYRGKELAYDPSMVPTPINPESRKFQFTVCWEIENGDSKRFLSANLEKIISKLTAIDWSPFHIDFFLDNETETKKNYIFIEIEFSPEITFQCTTYALLNVEDKVIPLIEKVEENLSQDISFERSTKRYWNEELFILFE
jgi:hypothetical protein